MEFDSVRAQPNTALTAAGSWRSDKPNRHHAVDVTRTLCFGKSDETQARGDVLPLLTPRPKQLQRDFGSQAVGARLHSTQHTACVKHMSCIKQVHFKHLTFHPATPGKAYAEYGVTKCALRLGLVGLCCFHSFHRVDYPIGLAELTGVSTVLVSSACSHVGRDPRPYRAVNDKGHSFGHTDAMLPRAGLATLLA